MGYTTAMGSSSLVEHILTHYGEFGDVEEDMSLEAGVLVKKDGSVLHWHLPFTRSSVYLPDSRELWDVIWEHRNDVLGFAHSHPGKGLPHPSMEDLTTFRGVDTALGRSLLWWITSEDRVVQFQKFDWQDRDLSDYLADHPNPDHTSQWLSELRKNSRYA